MALFIYLRILTRVNDFSFAIHNSINWKKDNACYDSKYVTKYDMQIPGMPS